MEICLVNKSAFVVRLAAMSRNSLRRELPTYKRQGSTRRLVRTVIFIVVAVFLLTSIFQCTLLRSVAIRSISMSPTIHPGDFLVFSPLVYGKELLFSDHSFFDFGQPHRGDLVLLRPAYHLGFSFLQKFLDQTINFTSLGRFNYHPGGKLEKDWESSLILRRVIAVPGDEIYMENGRFFIRVKGTANFVDEFEASRRQYQIKNSTVPVREHDMVFAEEMSPLIVPPRTCFVSADNRDAALDSRHWGVVDLDSLRGQLLFRYWPIASFGLVH